MQLLAPAGVRRHYNRSDRHQGHWLRHWLSDLTLLQMAFSVDSTKIRLALFLLLVAVVFAPIHIFYFEGLWTREHYQFFPIAIFSAIALMWLRVDSKVPQPGRVSIALVAGMVTASVIATAFASYWNSPWLGFIGFVLMLAAGLCGFLDESGDRTLVYLIIPILLIVRPPLNLDLSAIQGLQRITSFFASNVLDLLKVDHIRNGNILEPYGEVPLMVEEACSGVQSLFTLLFLAAMVGIINRHRLFRIIVLMSAAVLAAGLMNVLRVTAIAAAAVWFDVDLAVGVAHEVTGYVVLIVATLLLVSADRLIYFMIAPIDSSADAVMQANPFLKSWNWFTRPTVPVSGTKPGNSATFKIIIAGLIVCLALLIPQFAAVLRA